MNNPNPTRVIILTKFCSLESTFISRFISSLSCKSKSYILTSTNYLEIEEPQHVRGINIKVLSYGFKKTKMEKICDLRY